MTTDTKQSWNERQVQDAVYIHCALKKHEIIVPNSCVFGWESDVISVNKSDFISEFEIKVTRADFKQDGKKARAALLANPWQETWGGQMKEHPRPNYFYYAVPEGLITPEEVPEYAGLIYVEKHVDGPELYYGTTTEVKAAKRLHKEKLTEWQRRQLCRALTGRYWRQRLGEKLDEVETPESDVPIEPCPCSTWASFESSVDGINLHHSMCDKSGKAHEIHGHLMGGF